MMTMYNSIHNILVKIRIYIKSSPCYYFANALNEAAGNMNIYLKHYSNGVLISLCRVRSNMLVGC